MWSDMKRFLEMHSVIPCSSALLVRLRWDGDAPFDDPFCSEGDRKCSASGCVIMEMERCKWRPSPSGLTFDI